MINSCSVFISLLRPARRISADIQKFDRELFLSTALNDEETRLLLNNFDIIMSIIAYSLESKVISWVRFRRPVTGCGWNTFRMIYSNAVIMWHRLPIIEPKRSIQISPKLLSSQNTIYLIIVSLTNSLIHFINVVSNW